MERGRLIVFDGVSAQIPDHHVLYKHVVDALDEEWQTPLSFYRRAKKSERQFLFSVWGYGDYGDWRCKTLNTQYYFVLYLRGPIGALVDVERLRVIIETASGWQWSQFRCLFPGTEPGRQQDIVEWLSPGADAKGPRPQVGDLDLIRENVVR